MTAYSALRRRLVSVGSKLASATLLVLTAASSVVYVEVSRHERESLLTARENAGTMVARLFAAGLVAPLTFADEKSVQEQTVLLMANDDVVYGGVWSFDADDTARSLHKVGEFRRHDVSIGPPAVRSAVHVERGRERILIETPVLDTAGKPVGVAQVAFSLDKENAAIAVLERRTLVGAAAVALGVAVLLLALTRTLVGTRLARLADAAKGFEEGKPISIDVRGSDEVGALARAFATMTDAIAIREERICERNRDLRRVFDNVAEGFVTVDRTGKMSDERSRVLDEWFGSPPASNLFSAYLRSVAPEVAAWVDLGWRSLQDSVLPKEVILDQLGRRFEYEGKSFDIEFRPINDDCALVLVVIRDVTERVERERAERGQREATAIFRKILADRAGFDEFCDEAGALVDVIVHDDGSDPPTVTRAIHTLKGISGMFEIESIVTFCHKVEQRMADEADGPTAAERLQFGMLWSAVQSVRDELGGEALGEQIVLWRDDYRRLLSDLDRGVNFIELSAFVRSWQRERASLRLDRVADQLRSIAQRLGKGDVEIHTQVTPPDLRLPSDRWAPIWTVFAHVLRNTIDHGIETLEERRAAAKVGQGVVSLSLRANDHSVELSISDDGRGIAWDRIRARAISLGLPVRTDADLMEALFADSVSSKDAATEISGRGVGMGAMRAVVQGHGGSVVIESRQGKGTSCRLVFPLSMLAEHSPSGSLPPLRNAA